MAGKQKRRFNVFSLSFLDIMSCGFGATVLVFMLIHHSTLERSDSINEELLVEISDLRQEIDQSRQFLIEADVEVDESDQKILELQARVRRLLDQTAQARDELATQNQTTLAQRQSLEQLMADVRALDEQAKRLEGAAEEKRLTSRDARSFVGPGSRQYLTGLQLGGRNILILLDSSASMLDTTLVNIIRRRNMPLERKVDGPKWQRSIRTVEWILTNLPETSDYQVYHFNENAYPLLPDAGQAWFAADDKSQLGKVAAALRTIDPGKGTSLFNAFASIQNLDPIPDNVILITDGLPTMGENKPTRRTITARNRLRLFRRSVQELPLGVPVNTILFPIEGDPEAAGQFWRLATVSGGSFMSPSRDWP